ncbi:MAG: lamin tail domain-containing protein, partial [Pirellulales bacterium]
MRQSRARRVWSAERLESRLVLDAAVVFNEIMYNPAVNGTPEWIELHNELSYNVDLSGWRIEGAVELTFGSGTLIAASGYLVATIDPGALTSATGYSGAIGPWTGSLDNGGETIRLRNNNDRIMDEVDYGDDNRWPVGPDGSGATLAKLRPQTASGTPENWGTSDQLGGTPGALNFAQSTQLTVDTTLSPITATWKYHDAGVDLGAAWYAEAYDDSAWASGNGLFYHEPDPLPAAKNSPLAPGRATYYFRSTFDFNGNLDASNLRLNAVVDDGAVYYLNGQEVLRQNMPAGPIAYGTPATAQVGNARFSGQLAIPPGHLRQGENVLAVEVHQAITDLAYAQAVLNSEPVAYWKLDEATTAAGALGDSADALGPPQDGTQSGTFSGLAAANLAQPGPRPTDFIGGQPLAGFAPSNAAPNFQGTLDGGNDAAVFADDGNLNFSAGKAFSLEAWINGPAGQEIGAAIFAKGAGGGGEQFALDLVAGGQMRFYVWNGGSPNTPTVLQTTATPNGTWQHIAATFDQAAGVMRLYVNGQQVGTTAPPATLLSTPHEVSLGARKNQNSSAYDLNFSGRIDEAAVYDRALSPEEVLAHYTAAFDGSAMPGLDTSDAVFGVQIIAAETLTDLTIDTDTLFNLDTTWKYDDTGVDRGSTWRDPSFDDAPWTSGNALLYLEESPLPGPKNTPLAAGRTTYYFRKSFELTGDPQLVTGLRIRPIVDDGAIVYLNGQEVYRHNMPTGDVSYGTFASTAVDNAALLDPITISPAALVQGTNVLAVEVHQRAPEVIGSGTLPTVSSGTLRLQLDADAADVVKNATTNRVSQWIDRAGTADSFSQGLAASQPLWVNTVLNSRPVLRFDGGDRLDAIGAGLNAADMAPFTFFMVTAGTTDPFAAFDSAPSQQNTFRFGAFGGPPTPNFAVELWDKSPTLPITLANAGSIVSARVSRNSGNRLLETRVITPGVTTPASASGNASPVLFANVDIGTINAGANGFFRGDIAEILLYSGKLSDADRDAVEAYLKTRYGITGGPAEAEDIVFGTELTIDHAVPLGASLPLSINEIGAATDATFRVELANHGSQPIDLAGFILARDGQGAAVEHTFASQTVVAGQLIAFDETTLGFEPAVGDRLFLYAPGKTSLLDAATVRDRARGRSADGTGTLLYTSTATPGTANQFALHDEVVINEILYHARPLAATAGTPGTYQSSTLLPIGHTWRYNQNSSGAGLPSGWAATAHDDGSSGWFSGRALLGYEPDGTPEPILTPLTVSTSQLAYYFETEFDFSGDLNTVELRLRHIIDDGAVFYLNGEEVLRYSLAGTITPTTLASPGVSNATYSGSVTIPKTALVVGTNLLSVEVHQSAPGSTDIVFGAELRARVQLTPPVPGLPFRESDEEWIELYNRGPTTVNLGGWQLDDAVQYTFLAGTQLAPGGYAVIVRDAVDFMAAHPGVTFVGEYNGTLANDTEQIVLRDSAGNPADAVRYFDGGRWSDLADGSGASLELRDPDSDNSRGESWA